MAQISIRIVDLGVAVAIKKMQKNGKNLRPLLTKYSGLMHVNILNNFRREGSFGDMLSSPSGVPAKTLKKWKPLSSLTKASRRGKALQASNRLRMSIGTVRRITDKTLEYGTNLHYAPLMHYGTKKMPGGVLRPKKSKYLAIPWPGVHQRPRRYKNTFVATSKKGNKIIFQNMGGGEVRPLFTLKESVKIPARPFITLDPKTLDTMAKLAAIHITRGI